MLLCVLQKKSSCDFYSGSKLESRIFHYIWQAMCCLFVEFPGKSLQKIDPSCEVFTGKLGYGRLPAQKGRRQSLCKLKCVCFMVKNPTLPVPCPGAYHVFKANSVVIKTWHFLSAVMMSALTKTMIILVHIPHT